MFYGNEVMYNKFLGDKEIKGQSFLFVGEEHLGKFTLANMIAKKYGEIERNIHIIKAEKNNIAIDTIREMQDAINQLPLLNKKRVIIIDDCHCMNTATANSLLKVLEEPPSYCIFILITHKLDALLDTIKSRCSIERFYPMDKSEIETVVKENNYKFNKDILPYVNSIIKGRVGVLISLSDDVNLKEKEDNCKIANELLNNIDYTNTHKLVEGLSLKLLREINNYYCALWKIETALLVSDAIVKIESGASENLVLNVLVLNITKANRKNKKGDK